MKILLSGFCLLSFLSLSAQDSLTILFAGDAMMHQKQLDNTRRGDFFDLGSYFANIEREVKAADIAVVNFEVPLVVIRLSALRKTSLWLCKKQASTFSC